MIANLTTAPPAVHCQPADYSAAADRLDLRGVVDDDGELFAIFAAGEAQRVVSVTRDALASFAAFQRHVAEVLGVEVRHPRLTWAETVRRAFARGGAG